MSLLLELSAEQYVPLFAHHRISLEMLGTMSASDLEKVRDSRATVWGSTSRDCPCPHTAVPGGSGRTKCWCCVTSPRALRVPVGSGSPRDLQGELWPGSIIQHPPDALWSRNTREFLVPGTGAFLGMATSCQQCPGVLSVPLGVLSVPLGTSAWCPSGANPLPLSHSWV